MEKDGRWIWPISLQRGVTGCQELRANIYSPLFCPPMEIAAAAPLQGCAGQGRPCETDLSWIQWQGGLLDWSVNKTCRGMLVVTIEEAPCIIHARQVKMRSWWGGAEVVKEEALQGGGGERMHTAGARERVRVLAARLEATALQSSSPWGCSFSLTTNSLPQSETDTTIYGFHTFPPLTHVKGKDQDGVQPHPTENQYLLKIHMCLLPPGDEDGMHVEQLFVFSQPR